MQPDSVRSAGSSPHLLTRTAAACTFEVDIEAPDSSASVAVDEFSAVSRRLPIWQLYERARSLGLAVQVSAQSWPGLAADEDERYRVATTADGGIWLLRTPHPEPVAALAGARRVVDTARRLLGVPLWAQRGWAHEGLSRAEGTPVVDPEIIRGLDVGQAAYIYRGGVTYVQVKRLVAGPAELASGGIAEQVGEVALEDLDRASVHGQVRERRRARDHLIARVGGDGHRQAQRAPHRVG